MAAFSPIFVPLVNPNEPEAVLAWLAVTEGQPVQAGAPLATFETTKATAELSAERDGFVRGLRLAQGANVKAGERLCYLADSLEAPLPVEVTPPLDNGKDAESAQLLPQGLRITKPAIFLAKELGVALDTLPLDGLVTEKRIRELAGPAPEMQYGAEAILVYGGGGHGKAVIELLGALGGYNLIGVVDDGLPAGGNVLGVPVLGGSAVLGRYFASGLRLAVNAVGGISNIATRVAVFEKLKGVGFRCPAVIHPRALVEPSAELADGVQVFPLAYVGSAVRLGYGAIINTGAIVSHDCVLNEYANLSPGAILAGGVIVEARALVGMGVTVNLGVRIGAGARVGNGATVKADVPAGGVVRAGSTWPAG